MKIAYLILAHHQANYLQKLVNFIHCDWENIFIHIDAKFDIVQFQRLIPEDHNICFRVGSKRVKVNWGGFSQVTATLNLLKAALSSDIEFLRSIYIIK